MTRLEFTHTTKRFGDLTAVDDLTFAPAPGRVTGFVGNNGAGKSTAMRMLLGLTRPTSGSATVDGKPYADLADPLRAVGAMVDPGVFHPGRSGRNALRVLARAARISDHPRPGVENPERVQSRHQAQRDIRSDRILLRLDDGSGHPPILTVDKYTANHYRQLHPYAAPRSAGALAV